MSITFGNGITLGAGIAITPAPVVPLDLRFDTNYIGSVLGTAYNDTNLFDMDSGQNVCLTTEKMSASGKYMTSWCATYVTDAANLIGIATRAVDLNNYLGSDLYGLGIGQDQTLYWDGGGIDGGFPVWGQGDVVDVAVDNSASKIWMRVNGGDWNGDPAADPATNTNGMSIPGGLTAQYFAVCIGGFSGGSNIAMLLQSTYAIPAGFTFWGPGPTFTVESADFGNGQPIYQNTIALGANGTEGFENTASENWLGEGWYGYNLTPEAITKFDAAMTSAGIDPTNTTGYVWLATWGTGSSISFGLVKIGYRNGIYALMDIQAIDPDDLNWQNSGNNSGTSLVGTFKFPATFTIYSPLTNKGNWC